MPLSVPQSRQLYYGEWFSASVLVRDPAGGPVDAFAWPDSKLLYEERDELALPALAETVEETPYGQRKGITVYVERLADYLAAQGADSLDINNSLLVDANYRDISYRMNELKDAVR